VRLGGTDFVNSVVICHPGSFSINEVKAIKVPTAWVCAEGIYNKRLGLSEILKLLSEDMFFSESLRLASEAVFAERKDKENYIDYELKVYEGTDKKLLLA
jgi:carboxymethylenebutenolidase